MNYKIKTVLLVFLAIITNSVAQESKALRKANEAFKKFAYVEAAEAYEDILRTSNGTVTIFQKLGDSYFYNSELEKAARWYEKMIATRDTIVIPAEYYFRTAQCYKHLEKYEEAAQLMDTVQQLSTKDSRAKRLADNPDYLEDIKLQSERFEISNLKENSWNTDFAPSFYKNQLVFSSSRKEGATAGQHDEWTERPYLQLYSGVIKTHGVINYPLVFSKKLRSKLHESTSTFTKDGKTIYFTRNNIINSKISSDSLDIVRLRIFVSTQNDHMKWESPQPLFLCTENYSAAHPALSPDGKKLYFASDMPGGYGMSDLYVVTINENGTLGIPKNLGPDINTEGRDTFPFVSSDGTLYFASDGHLGLGGLDLFTAYKTGDETKIYNLGAPINSPADDVTFIINEQTQKGYFASNRKGGKGDDDIYSFVQTKPLFIKCEGTVNGIAVDEKSGVLLTNATVKIFDKNDTIIHEIKTNNEGRFSVEADCNDKDYKTWVSKEGYDAAEGTISLSRKDPNPLKMFRLKSNAPEKGVDLAKLLALNPIYFETNKAIIKAISSVELDKVVKYMKEYQTINIEIGSHTDSRGSDTYNQKLSAKRALTTANYIVSKGIDPSRVKSRGYGETVLKNRCGNGVKCSKAEHQENRRSEFIVINN